MATLYTITNICPKQNFTTLAALHKYCETHPVPVNYNRDKKFIIEKTVTSHFTLPGMEIDTSIDRELALDLVHKIADKIGVNNNIRYSAMFTPYNSYYFYNEGEADVINHWVSDFLRNVKAPDICECLDVHTNYKKCNGYAIHINTMDDDAVNAFVKAYDAEHGTHFTSGNIYKMPLWDTVIHKVAGGKPTEVDFSTFTSEEYEFFKTCVEPRHLYIQFRDDDIMIDGSYYTGRNVSHRQNNPINFDKKRYDWCIECLNGNFKKFK